MSPFENPFRETVIARYDDRRDGFCLGIVVEHDESLSDGSTVDAMRAAAREHASGHGACGGFNWGDLVNDVPEETCIRHGFRIIDTFVTHLIVDHNEHIMET